MPLDSEAPELTPEQVAEFQAKGWLIARGFFTPEEAATLSDWSDEILAWPEKPGEHMVYYEADPADPERRFVQRIENICPYHADFDRFVRRGRIIRAVGQLMGGRALLFKEKINFKMPGGAGFEPHQDQQAGWSDYAPLFVTALVGVDPATLANGCLEMAETPRYAGLIGDEWKPLTAEQMADFALTPAPTEPGDVVFFDSYAPHASKRNTTDRARRILYLTYNLETDGDHRAQYYADKRRSFPPDIEREPGKAYRFRV